MRSAAVASLVVLGACVDLGTTPNTVACTPSPDFYVSTVFPRYLQTNQCVSGGCHSFDGGHGTLRLQPPEIAPAPGTPLDAWPMSWRQNYLSTIQLVRCDAPPESRLLTVPEGLGNLHPPGPVVLDRVAAFNIVTGWVAAP
jgi:hypothetical protein